MRVLVCGSRNFIDITLARNILAMLPKDTVIIQGDASGADSIAKSIACELGFRVESYPADWKAYGKSAGPIRNQQMLDVGKPDKVIAFFRDMNKSPGTWDMIRRSQKADIPVETFVSASDIQVGN